MDFSIHPLSMFVFLFYFKLCVDVCVGMWVYVHVSTGGNRVQNKDVRSLELELQEVVSRLVWVLETELWSTAKSS